MRSDFPKERIRRSSRRHTERHPQRHAEWHALAAGIIVLLALIVSPLAVAAAGAEDKSARKEAGECIVVVVNRENPVERLELAALRRMYLRQEEKWPNGWSVTAYERPSESGIRRRFSRLVLRKMPEELNEYWMNLRMTRGLKPPPVCQSARLVKEHLARVKGGVGYIFERELDETVKRIEVKGVE